MSDWNPDDCAGGLCPPHKLPAHLRHFDHCVWSRAPGELWWRRRAYCRREDARGEQAAWERWEPESEFAVRPIDAGPPGEGEE